MKDKIYKQYIQGKVITDCAIINKEEMAFVTKEMPISENDHRPIEDRASGSLLYSANRWQKRGGFAYVGWKSGIEFLKVAYDDLVDGEMCCDSIWNGYEMNLDDKYALVCQKEDQDDYTRGSEGIVYIDGEAYMYGVLHKVFKRTGIHQWIDLTDPNQHPNLFKELKKMKEERGNYGLASVGFSAMDGFSSADIYAGGEKGDVWHYNGEKWRRIDVPANFFIHTITCAEDGKVYMAGYTGGILVGREDSWKLLDESGGKIFGSSAYFNGVMYFSGDSGLHYLKDEKLKAYKFPKDSPSIYSYKGGCVASSKDTLLVCSEQEALVFDGVEWKEIIGNPVLSGDA